MISYVSMCKVNASVAVSSKCQDFFGAPSVMHSPLCTLYNIASKLILYKTLLCILKWLLDNQEWCVHTHITIIIKIKRTLVST